MSHARLSRRTRFGFTLMELIVTIVILGILAALAVPAFSAVQDRSRDSVDETSVAALGREAAALAAFNGTAVTAADLELAIADLGSAADNPAATDAVYDRDTDGILVPGEWDFLGYAGATAYAAFVPGRLPGGTERVLYLQVAAAAADAKWGTVAEDGDATSVTAADAGIVFEQTVTADDGGTAPSGETSTGTTEPVTEEPTWPIDAWADDASVTLAWQAPDNADQYTVGLEGGDTLWTGAALSYTATGLTNGTQVCFQVAATAAGAPVAATTVCATPKQLDTQAFAAASQGTFVVPAGVYTIKVDALGGAGGARSELTSKAPGGPGLRLAAWLPVTPGETLHVRVGGNGNGRTAGYNGGGAGGYTSSTVYGGGGGGASDVRRDIDGNGAYALDERIVVAGGGGGGGQHYGGTAYFPNGANGSGYSNCIGGGGTTTAGGQAKPAHTDCSFTATSGTFGVGGNGGAGTKPGSGGGGGWYGGAGSNGGTYTGGGAAGSSHLTPDAVRVTAGLPDADPITPRIVLSW